MLYDEFFSSFNSQYKDLFGPYVRFNSLVAKNFADLTSLQLESARNYANILSPNFSPIGDLRDINSLSENASKQFDTMLKVSQQMIDDGKKMFELANDFKQELDKIVKDSLPKSSN